MKRTYYGISMGSFITHSQQLEGVANKSEFEVVSDYIMARMIKEFLYVEANMITPVEEIEIVGREVYLSDDYHPVLQELRCVFDFESKEYFSDIVKTAELVVDDVGRLLLDTDHYFTKWDSIERICFREFFKAYSVEGIFDMEVTEDQALKRVFEKLDDLEIKGRKIKGDCTLRMRELLAREQVRAAVNDLVAPNYA